MEAYTSVQRLVEVVPSERQLVHQSLEFYAFIHFTVNTFTDKEWGDGTEPESIFNPTQLDAEQWAEMIEKAGMKGMILTCKHHDGFCLWPSKYTTHTVANSPYKNGTGDIVKEAAEACKKRGLKFGIYLSPWDRNHETYGYGDAYSDYFVNQLTELLTGYGDIFSVWFDGACGEGSNGKKQVYDWERYYAVIRKLQPNACISVCGPDIRWCGNEAGDTRPSEWSVVPKRTKDTEKVAEKSQQADEEGFRSRKLTASDLDLGSREILNGERDLIWYPAEVNTSIRPGWFYHKSEDDKVRSLDELLSIYFHSVGGNATFLLNLPPDTRGLIHEADAKRLEELGTYLKKAFSNNIIEEASLFADSSKEGCSIDEVRTDCYDTYYQAKEGCDTACIEIDWREPRELRYVVLKENIKKSQRIEQFVIEAKTENDWHTIYTGTVVGYKKIACLEPIQTKQIRIRVEQSRMEPTLAFLGVY